MKNGLPPSGARTAKTSRGFSRATSRVQTPEQSSGTSTGSKFVDNVLGFDKMFSKWVHENCLTDFTYAFLRFFEYSGDGLFWLPATAAFWLSPGAGRPETRMFVFNVFIGLIFDLFVVGCIKAAVRRKRPTYNRGHLVVVSMDQWSFPSGHSTRALMIVTFIWLYLPMWQDLLKRHWYPYLVVRYEENTFLSEYVLPSIENWIVAIANTVLIIWALATLASRVVLGRHYFLDVIGGVVIGILETLVAHYTLYVPQKVSELQHAWVISRFSLYEEAVWRFFHGQWFITHFQFR